MTDDKDHNRQELEEVNARLRLQMENLGFAFQIAGGNEEHAPYLYTVGLAEKFGHPEVYVMGLPSTTAAAMLERLVARIAEGERFDRPQYVDNIIHYEMPVMPITAAPGILPKTGAVQLFFPDPNGHVPWEPECDPEFGGVQTTLFQTVGSYPERKVPLDDMPPPSSRPSAEEIRKRMRKGVDLMREQIEQNGFTFQPVFPSDEGGAEPFVYTIGLSKTFDHPEIYVVGLDANSAVNLILSAIEKISGGERLETPTFFTDEDGDVFPVRPLSQDDVDRKSGLGQRVLGYAFPAVQVYYPDENGLFPWEDGCDPEYARQAAELRPTGDPPNLPAGTTGRTLH